MYYLSHFFVSPHWLCITNSFKWSSNGRGRPKWELTMRALCVSRHFPPKMQKKASSIDTRREYTISSTLLISDAHTAASRQVGVGVIKLFQWKHEILFSIAWNSNMRQKHKQKTSRKDIVLKFLTNQDYLLSWSLEFGFELLQRLRPTGGEIYLSSGWCCGKMRRRQEGRNKTRFMFKHLLNGYYQK